MSRPDLFLITKRELKENSKGGSFKFSITKRELEENDSFKNLKKKWDEYHREQNKKRLPYWKPFSEPWWPGELEASGRASYNALLGKHFGIKENPEPTFPTELTVMEFCPQCNAIQSFTAYTERDVYLCDTCNAKYRKFQIEDSRKSQKELKL